MEEESNCQCRVDPEDIISRFERDCEDAASVQADTLRKILLENHRTEYLAKWLGDIDLDKMDAYALESLFTKLVPLVSHTDIKLYILRIADGERSPVLTRKPIELLSLSFGTTDGRQKYVPFTRHSAQTTLQIFRLAAAYRSRMYPIREGGKILEFIYGSKQFKMKGGLTAGLATAHYYGSEEFRTKQEETRSFTCSPKEVLLGGNYEQSTYCHLLLGLYFCNQVEFVTSTFAFSIVQAFRSFEESWRDIYADIRDGTLSPRVSTQEMRRAVLDVIAFLPKPELAKWIRSCCEKLEGSAWSGVVPKLWLNVKYVYTIMTGSMQPYLTKLRHYAGGVPLVGADYGSTESWIGVNVNPCAPPEKTCFVVVPTFSYFEFVPLHQQSRSSRNAAVDDFVEGDPVPLSRVKVGQEYEVVLTTFTGLYRYRLGDVVEVAGFHGRTPKLNFICRRKLILAINIDKNTEKDLQLVVDSGSRLLTRAGGELIDFTSQADLTTLPGHYVIYWEIRGDVEEGVLMACCSEMDSSFKDQGYVHSRKLKSIGPLELRVLGEGSFRKVLDSFISNGAALSQFKTPRCTSNKALLSILDASTIKRFRSTAYGYSKE